VLSGNDQIRIDSIQTWLPRRMDEETRHGRGPAVTRTPRYTRTSKQSAAWLRATVVAPLLATVPAFALLAALMAAP